MQIGSSEIWTDCRLLPLFQVTLLSSCSVPPIKILGLAPPSPVVTADSEPRPGLFYPAPYDDSVCWHVGPRTQRGAALNCLKQKYTCFGFCSLREIAADFLRKPTALEVLRVLVVRGKRKYIIFPLFVLKGHTGSLYSFIFFSVISYVLSDKKMLHIQTTRRPSP